MLKCGWEGSVRELYPETFAPWSDCYKKTPEDPTAAADAYLTDARRLNLMGVRSTYPAQRHVGILAAHMAELADTPTSANNLPQAQAPV